MMLKEKERRLDVWNEMLAAMREAVTLADDAADGFRRAGMPDASKQSALLGDVFRAVVAKATGAHPSAERPK